MDARVRWSALEAALSEDLHRWHGRDDGDERAAYVDVARTLISCKKPSKRLATLQAKVCAKQAYVNALARLAGEADSELMRRNPRGYHSRFQALHRAAATIDMCLDDMLIIHREGHARLETQFTSKRLFWQGM